MLNYPEPLRCGERSPLPASDALAWTALILAGSSAWIEENRSEPIVLSVLNETRLAIPLWALSPRSLFVA